MYWEKDAEDGVARKDDGYIGRRMLAEDGAARKNDGYIGRRMLKMELPGKMMGILGEGC